MSCQHTGICSDDPGPWHCDECGALVCVDCADEETGLCMFCAAKLIETEALVDEEEYYDEHDLDDEEFYPYGDDDGSFADEEYGDE